MGSKGSKKQGKDVNQNIDITNKKTVVSPKITDKDIKFLVEKTGMTKDQINGLLAKFNQDNPDGKLDKAEFMKLYPTLRNEPIQNLDEITNMIFRGK
jgi:hypothetical protein